MSLGAWRRLKEARIPCANERALQSISRRRVSEFAPSLLICQFASCPSQPDTSAVQAFHPPVHPSIPPSIHPPAHPVHRLLPIALLADNLASYALSTTVFPTSLGPLLTASWPSPSFSFHPKQLCYCSCARPDWRQSVHAFASSISIRTCAVPTLLILWHSLA